MKTIAPTPPPETLPLDAVMFASKRTRSKYAKNVVSHIGWWHGFDGKGDIAVAYYFPKDLSCWKLLKPNTSPGKDHRQDRFGHRGVRITPSSTGSPGIAAMLKVTAAHESVKHC